MSLLASGSGCSARCSKQRAPGRHSPACKAMSKCRFDTVEVAFAANGLKNTHPISSDVRSVGRIEELFDAIGYNKVGSDSRGPHIPEKLTPFLCLPRMLIRLHLPIPFILRMPNPANRAMKVAADPGHCFSISPHALAAERTHWSAAA